MPQGVAPLPSFLIIGAQKSATRWLRMNLGEHPEVFTAPRELAFFSGGWFEDGLDAYRRAFEGWSGEPIVGEATPAYMMWRQRPARTARRIGDKLPGVRLLALLRDPVDRAYSAFVHHVQRGRIPVEADLLDRLRSVAPEDDKLALVAGGWYAESLGHYMTTFGDRLLIMLNDDAVAAPERLYAHALEHIGASPEFRPRGLTRVRHHTAVPTGSPHTDGNGDRRPLTPAERQEAFGYFERDVDRLEELLGRSLDAWRPD